MQVIHREIVRVGKCHLAHLGLSLYYCGLIRFFLVCRDSWQLISIIISSYSYYYGVCVCMNVCAFHRFSFGRRHCRRLASFEQ